MYICVENQTVISIAEEAPHVPNTVKVFHVYGDDATNIKKGTHHFDVNTETVVENPVEVVDQNEMIAKDNLKYLAETDWIVLRHIREKFLGVQLSITDEQYAQLEVKRQAMAKMISN